MDRSKMELTLVFVATVTFSLVLRIAIIRATPQYDRMIDLEIYMAAGALVRAGVDPYDYQDSPAVREMLRERATSPWLRESQVRWNAYVSAFLPFVAVVMGLIGCISEEPRTFRLFFSFGDALACGIAAILFSALCRQHRRWLALGTGLLVGAWSPFFVYYGTVIPEPKGTQLLLMLAVVLLLNAQRRLLRVVVLPSVLGLSIAFYGLGIVFMPIAFWKVLRYSKDRWLDASVFCAVLCVTTVIWLVPFGGNMGKIMVERITVGRTTLIPNHSIVWRVVMAFVPTHWPTLRVVSLLLFGGAIMAAWLSRRINYVGVACLSVFVYICLVIVGGMGGAMDRANIGVTMGIVGVALSNLTLGFWLACVYALLGAARVAYGHEIMIQLRAWGLDAARDVAFVDAMCVAVMVVLVWCALMTITLMRCNRECKSIYE